MKPAHVVALVVIVISLCVTLYAFNGAIAQHVDFASARSSPGQTVQVPGNIVKDSVHYSTANGKGELRFDIIGIDPKTRQVNPAARMTVVYDQPKPENFDSAVGVEAIGQYRDGEFHAHTLLVKCPSKYADEKKQSAKM